MQDRNLLLTHSLTDIFNSLDTKILNKIALTCNENHLTYRQLEQRSNQIANWFKENNINQRDCIAILLAPGIDYIVLILAIAKTGAIYVPLDNLAPDTRLKEIITDSEPVLIISDDSHSHLLKNIECTVSMIKKINLQSASLSSKPVSIKINPADPAYIMYTSGSTGKPKGVIISHQSIINLVKIDNYASIQKYNRIGQFSSLAFDGSTFEIWSALLHGSELVIIPKEKKTNPPELKRYLEQTKISHLFLPTGYFHQLIKTAPDTLNSVNCIVFGGEQANTLLVKNFLIYRKKENLPLKLINGYGPTEATTFTCRHVMNEESTMSEAQLSSIGFPIQNVEIYILDENLNEVPEGELYIGGLNLALGYHNCTEQNQSKFIINPFAKSLSPKLYKTGDKVTRLSSGEYVCLGRLDDQVKVGGFRIHLNEIEKHLMEHEAQGKSVKV